MLKMPSVEPPPRPNSAAISQTEGSPRSALKEPEAGESPANSPPPPHRANSTATITDRPPSSPKAARQEDQRRKSSAISGTKINARLGAISWIASALPQWLESISAGIVAMAEGMERAGGAPRNMSPRRMDQRLLA